MVYVCTLQGLLTHVVVHQPEDPIAYFHEELSRIKKEVEENNVSSVPSALSIFVLHKAASISLSTLS